MMMNDLIVSGGEVVPVLPDWPISKTIFQKLKNQELNKLTIIEVRSGEILTQKEAFDKIVRFTINLQKLGARKGDLIAIVSENSYRYAFATISAFLLGVKVQCLNPEYTINEIRHFFKIATPKFVCCSAITLEIIEALNEDFHYSVICLNQPEKICSVLNYNDLLSTIKQEEIDKFRPSDVEIEESAMLLTSSGTTGLPKVVEVKHCGILHLMQYCLHPNFMDINSNEVTLSYLPFFHATGILLTYSSLLAGSKTIIMDKFHPEVFLNLIETHSVTKLFAVPPTVLFLAKSPLVDQYNVSSIKDIVCGGAPLKTEIEEYALKRLNIPCVRQLYGLTEVTGLITMSPVNAHRFGSVGKILPWLQVKIYDIEAKKFVGPYKIGELRAKTRALMKGYCSNVKETRAAFDEDGWLKTGDLGYYDEDGYFYIVDRVKEMIKYKGFQVAPAELEGILLGHPAVKDAGVVGIPDERAGEIPLAFVVKQQGVDVTEAELVRFVAENVSRQKQLYGGVRFVNEIPKTASGKLMRRKLRELAIKN